MSDADLIRALDDLEQMLQGELDPEAITAWRHRFDTELASADRGPGWPQIVDRAHGLAGRLDAAAQTLSDQLTQVRKELAIQARGERALKGYKPS